MTPKELEQFIKVARRQGVLKLQIGDVSFELTDVQAPKQAVKKSEAEAKDTPEQPWYSDEQMLFWSSQGAT